MQSTIEPNGDLHKEFFEGINEKDVYNKMDLRLSDLLHQGHKFHKREMVPKSGACPCGSGKIFNNCCRSRVRKG